MQKKLGPKTLARYHEEYLWPLFEKQKMDGGYDTFQEFITEKILAVCDTELDLRNLLGLAGERIIDYSNYLANYSEQNALSPEKVLVTTNQILYWRCVTCSREWSTQGVSPCPDCRQKEERRAYLERCNLAAMYPRLATAYSDRNELPATMVDAREEKEYWWRCGDGHEFQALLKNAGLSSRWVQIGRSCPNCQRREAYWRKKGKEPPKKKEVRQRDKGKEVRAKGPKSKRPFRSVRSYGI